MVSQLTESYVCENQFTKTKKGNIVAGIFQRADVRNINGRVYRRPLWEKILARPDIQAALKERRMLGELGHPDCVETTAVNVSHIVTDLKLLPSGEIYGEAEILDTPSGRILKTLYEAGVKMGISSRGYLPEGSNLYPEGKDLIVPDDFELITFDFVIEPSTPGANPTIKESVKSKLTSILTEGRDKVNAEVASYIEGLSCENTQKPLQAKSKSSSLKVLSEASTAGKPNFKMSKEEENISMENAKYIEKLQAIISDLRDRYLIAESVIEKLTAERVTANDILQDISKRYLTSEAVIKEFRDYALSLESALADVTKLQQVSESVVEDLRSRYTLSESIIADLRDRYTLSEGTIAELKERLLNEKPKSKVQPSESVTEAVISELKNRCQVAEDVISNLSEMVKESNKPAPKKKRTPVPEGYFEGISEKYNISVSEAKSLFKNLGCRKSSFEFHLEERKRLTSKPYAEYPYMINEAPVSNVYSTGSKKETEEERIARIVSHGF